MSSYNIRYLRKQINLLFSFRWYGVKWLQNVQSLDTLVFIEDFEK